MRKTRASARRRTSGQHRQGATRFGGRCVFAQALLLVLFAGLAYRAFDIQVLHPDFLKDQGDARTLRTITVEPQRGMILDRNGKPMAVSAPVFSVAANPQEVEKVRDRFPQLEKLLGLKRGEVAKKLKKYRNKQFMWVERRVTPETADKVREMNLAGVWLEKEFKRYYPFSHVASHIVGFTSSENKGLEGMERAFDEQLRGKSGKQRVLKDRVGRVVERVENLQDEIPGENITTSIDSRLQYIASRELYTAVKQHKAKGGSLVLLDVRTGEILAMVNEPGFNPNNRKGQNPRVYKNLAVNYNYEPGSVLKPFTVLSALEVGQVSADTRIDTSPGYIQIGRFTVRDHRDFGLLTVSHIIKKSSNVGVAKIADQMNPERMWKTLDDVGFGHTPNSGLPGESAGRVPGYAGWKRSEQITMAYGYHLMVTPLQLARAYAVLARRGKQLPVTILKHEKPADGLQMFTPSKVDAVVDMMRGVVESGGTAPQAALEHFAVSGKTGTAHKISGGRYSKDLYMASFAGFAPANNPRLAMAVMVDEPSNGKHFGGDVAAPVFHNVMREALRLLNVAPESNDKGQSDLHLRRVGIGDAA